MSFQNCSENTLSKSNNVIHSDERVLILLDVEGIIGVSSMKRLSDVAEKTHKELSIMVSTLKQEGYKNITVWNIHNDGTCLDCFDLSELGIDILRGIKNLSFIANNYDFALMAGFHGMRASGGRFDHTFREDILHLQVGDKSIGEVGAFYRWLSMVGIPVVFVSGEGNFASEIAENPCVIHYTSVIPTTSSEAALEYEALSAALQSSLHVLDREQLKKSIFSSEEVLLTMANPDIYRIMNNFQQFAYENRAFHFESLSSFFEQLFIFAMHLNVAAQKIYSHNIRFLSMVRQVGFCKEALASRLESFADIDISMLDYQRRKLIAERVEMKYEDFLRNEKMLCLSGRP